MPDVSVARAAALVEGPAVTPGPWACPHGNKSDAPGGSGAYVGQELIIPDDGGARRLRRLRRIVLGGADQIARWARRSGRRYRVAMVTLTYRPGEAWSRQHVSRLLDCYRSWLARRRIKLRAVWVMELTRAGVPHYHVLLWIPWGVRPPLPDKSGWWRHGCTQAAWARRAIGYLAKYASKGINETHQPPRGARLYAVLGCPLPLGWWRCSGWCRERSKPGDKITQSKGGWTENRTAGWKARSPWCYIGRDVLCVILRWRGWPEGSWEWTKARA